MRVKFHAREIGAHAEPMKGGYFLKCDHPAASGIGKGDEFEVQAAKLEVQYVIAFPGGEAEVWMLATPKKAEAAIPFRFREPPGGNPIARPIRKVAVAEWSGAGLQTPIRGFDSRLQHLRLRPAVGHQTLTLKTVVRIHEPDSSRLWPNGRGSGVLNPAQ